MNNITVLLPIHKLEEGLKPFLINAIKSVEEQSVRPDTLMLIIPANDTELKSYLETIDYGAIKESVKIVLNENATDFCSQINFGVSQCETEWFSFIEYDDEYSKIWFKNVLEYIKHYPTVDLFLPIIVDVNDNSQFVGFMNEPVWANEFSMKMGYLDNDALLAYPNFNFDGMVIKKSTFLEFGGLKTNIKLTFIYEFLLRLTYKSVGVMTIPKLGYKHINQRKGGLFNSYFSEMDANESKFWLETARNEYYYDYEREITKN